MKPLPTRRTEMVFLSYKASMSDSLETIYLAAKADPNCDAYFIPIPYYDVQPNGDLGDMHYEGAEHYPAHLTLTDYRTYNIAQRQPDAIFSYYPYDVRNYVTRIPSDYFFENLQLSTDMLVYVPYFVEETTDERFMVQPGPIYADRVIVTSQRHQANYEAALRKAGYDQGLDEKIIVLGSPKIDKLLTASPADFDLPQSWATRIRDRQVVLYNTSIAAMLSNPERYFLKLYEVFQHFKDSERDVLWWRPHPLLLASYGAMAPTLLSAYKSLLLVYETQEYGILDTTSDLHRALAYSDVYYGDESSLLYLYAFKNQPSIQQNIYDLDEILDLSQDLSHTINIQDCVNQDGTAGQKIYDYINAQFG